MDVNRKVLENKLSRAIATARAKQVADKEYKMTKGTSTSEFWGTGAMITAATVLLQNGTIGEQTWALAAGGSLVAYIVSRWLVKTSTPKGGETNGI